MIPSLVKKKFTTDEIRAHKREGFKWWMKQAKRHYNEPECERLCRARAYASPDGFLPFCRDIIGYKDLVNHFHKGICTHVTNPKHRYKMLQACRGSFKSCIATIAYSTWLIGREYTLYDRCNIRILIGSEVLQLTGTFMRAIRQILEWNEDYKELFGDHKGAEHRKSTGRVWSDTAIISRYRTLPYLKEPTVSAIALGAPRAGNHYDVIIADDLETERASASRDMIDKCWIFYKLLHALLEPRLADYVIRVLPRPEMSLVSTRWHHQDIYARIIEDNEEEVLLDEQYAILIKPARMKDGTLTFPERFDEDELAHKKRKLGPYIFACQFLMDPTPSEDRTFKKSWFKFATPQHYNQPNMLSYLSTDFAFTEYSRIARGEVRNPDFTVIFVCMIDEAGNIIFRDWQRGRWSKREAIERTYDMYKNNGCAKAAFQKFDRIQIEDVLESVGHERNERMNYDWIIYPGRESKEQRIETTLQPFFSGGKVYLMPGMEWFQDELLDFPRSNYLDGCDTLCNIVKISNPTHKTMMPEHTNPVKEHIDALKRGVLKGLDGKVYPQKKSVWRIFD
jgi:hypothetical protein